MKITCPSCAATYEVPEAVLASKRAVRCARCGNNWVPGADWAPEPAAEPVPAPAVAEPAEPAPPEAAAQEGSTPGLAVPNEPAHEVDAPEVAVPPTAAPAMAVPPVAAPAAAMEAPEPPAPPPAAPPPRVPPGPITASPAAPQAAPAAKQTPVVGWAVSIALVIMLAAAAIVFRGQMMHAWPPSERLYQALGLYHT